MIIYKHPLADNSIISLINGYINELSSMKLCFYNKDDSDKIAYHLKNINYDNIDKQISKTNETIINNMYCNTILRILVSNIGYIFSKSDIDQKTINDIEKFIFRGRKYNVITKRFIIDSLENRKLWWF